MPQSKVLTGTGQFTEEFNRLLDETSPEIYLVFVKIQTWLTDNDCDCMDYKLAYKEFFDFYVELQWQGRWQDCIEEQIST